MKNHHNNPNKAWGPRRHLLDPPFIPGHDDTCIVCWKGANTGLRFRSRYVLRALIELGMPQCQAIGTIQSAEHVRQVVHDTEYETIILLVCERCSAAVLNKVGRYVAVREVVPYYGVLES